MSDSGKKIIRMVTCLSLVLMLSAVPVSALETTQVTTVSVNAEKEMTLTTETTSTETTVPVTTVPVSTEKTEPAVTEPGVGEKTEPVEEKYIEYGIDISRYQGDINWAEFSQNDIGFVILRAGTSRYGIDSKFEEYYRKLRELDIKTGAYFYCSATNLEEFRKDAHTFLSYLQGKKMDMPVYIDLEDSVQPSVGKDALTTYAVAALNIINDAGFTTGVYSNKNWFTNYINRELVIKAGYEIWWAQYPSTVSPVNPLDYDLRDKCGIWQYSSLGRIKGINTSVDVNIAYKKYPLENTGDKMKSEKWLVNAKPSLRLRSGPGMLYGQIASIPPHYIVNVTDIMDSDGYKWGKINYNGYIGWCAIDYAQKITEENKYLLSYDINGDNLISISDEFQIRKGILLNGQADLSADMNNDGIVNVFDCQRIKRHIME